MPMSSQAARALAAAKRAARPASTPPSGPRYLVTPHAAICQEGSEETLCAPLSEPLPPRPPIRWINGPLPAKAGLITALQLREGQLYARVVSSKGVSWRLAKAVLRPEDERAIVARGFVEGTVHNGKR